MATAASFTVDVSKWVDGQKARIANAPLKIAYAFQSRLMELTPVETGTLRAGWQIIEGDEKHRVVNNIVYAQRINFGFIGKDSLGREYHQRGRHMVEQAIGEADQIIEQALR